MATKLGSTSVESGQTNPETGLKGPKSRPNSPEPKLCAKMDQNKEKSTSTDAVCTNKKHDQFF